MCVCVWICAHPRSWWVVDLKVGKRARMLGLDCVICLSICFRWCMECTRICQRREHGDSSHLYSFPRVRNKRLADTSHGPQWWSWESNVYRGYSIQLGKRCFDWDQVSILLTELHCNIANKECFIKLAWMWLITITDAVNYYFTLLLYNETCINCDRDFTKRHTIYNLPGTVSTKSCLFSWSWKNTLPHNLMVVYTGFSI